MYKTPAFWIAFVALSVLATVFAVRNFSAAFPLVSLNIQMDRDGAMKAARALAEKNGWPPATFDQAVEFSGDQEVQNFIELEGGGKQELGRILKEGIFATYTWRVRNFKESDVHETSMRFTPEGQPYGFSVKLPDKEAGASLESDAARAIAERVAVDDWRVDFSRYQLAESSEDNRPGGRRDHTFVYERQDIRAGEGRYRLRLVVGGDKLTGLTYFVQVPEAFSRRYEEMRSANTTIGAASSVATFLLYLLGICGIGLFFMMRQRSLIVRPAVRWAVLLGVLMAAEQLNSWPLLWMGYDTAVPASGFAIRQIAGAVGIFGALAVLLTISFMTAETLSRRAFPHHIQFWTIWSRPVAASKAVLGQTVAGYLLVSIFFAYEIVLYFFAQGKLGWWTPSDTLVNPNISAEYAPFLSAIAQALQAGFWEECLFRAAPLAAAALIGDRFGKRRAFIAVAMVVQALIFASGHAGYANQPAYARVVELIIPSFAFGGLYLAFGLLPGIILHYTFDAVWMAMPLFFSSAPGAPAQQALAVVLVLAPLWIVIAARVRSKRFIETPEEYLNGAWKPPVVEEQPVVEEAAPAVTTMPPLVSRVFPIAGLIGLALWIGTASFRTDAPPVAIKRTEAEEKARQALSDRRVQLDPSWTVLGRVEAQPSQADRFVWQKAGPERYRQLVGIYLTPPHWTIRFARFQGDVAERAEEYQVSVDGQGRSFRVSHDLPEARPGKTLSVDEARAIARAALTANFQIAPDTVKEITAEASKRPARGDWTFEFKDTRDFGLPEGEARIAIEIAGDEVADAYRYVYVPEDWRRNERAERNIPSIVSVACTIAIVMVVVTGAVIGIIQWSRGRPYSPRTFLVFLIGMFLLSAMSLLNNWPALLSQFPTAQPVMLQAAVLVSVSLMLSVFIAAGLALVAGLLAPTGQTSAHRAPLLGVAVGTFVGGIGALVRAIEPSKAPLWGSFAGASTYIPLLGAALAPLNQFFIQALILWLVFHMVHRKPQVSPLLVLVGLVLSGTAGIETLSSWLISGLVTGIMLMAVNQFVLKHQPRLILIAVATLGVLAGIREGLHRTYPAALPGSLLGAILIALAAYLWFTRNRRVEKAESRTFPTY